MNFHVYIHPGDDHLILFVGEENHNLIDQVAQSCTAISLYGFDWNMYLSPWKASKVFKKGKDFGGKADETIQEIINLFNQYHLESYSYRMIAGYSLAGLFSLYACTKLKYFNSCASVSGSLWFPGFDEYLLNHQVYCDHVYLSLGDQESKTSNPYLSTVYEQTMKTQSYLNSYTKCKFESNPGNHFCDEEGRMAKAVEYLLENEK